MKGDLAGSCGMVKDHGPLGGNLTVCWAAEMEGSQVASLNLGLKMYHHINQPRKRIDVVEMGKKCVEKK